MFKTLILVGLVAGGVWLYTNGYSVDMDKAQAIGTEVVDGLFTKTVEGREIHISK